MKKRYKKSKRYEGIFGLLIILIVAFLTIGFSAYQNDLEIDGIAAIVRIQKDIRITGINVSNSTAGAVSNYEDYNVKSISSSLSLPNSNSEMVYEIKVTNIGNIEMGISDIIGLPSNLKYTIEESNYKMKDPICDDNNNAKCKLGATKTIYLKISYNQDGYDASNTDYQFSLEFDFKKIYSITYNGFASLTGLPSYMMENENKTITFNNTTGIPADVLVSGATGSYNSPTLTLSNADGNITVYRKYLITYVLDGGVQAEGQVTTIASNETVTLLKPEKEEYNFSGWYDNVDLEGEEIKILSGVQSDITLYAGWSQYDYFIKNAEFDGTAEKIIDTGIQLYSAENVNRNFRIKFTIDDYHSSYETASNINNNQPPTILSSMVEAGSPYSGFVYRLVTYSGTTKYSIKVNDSHVSSFLGYYNLGKNIDVEIVRENGAIYTKINSNLYTKVLDYGGSIDTFNVPLTIGGNINASGNYDRLFKGNLSNVSVEFYEGSVIKNEYTYKETKTENSYKLEGTIEFNGSNYIDTGINLFSPENINKDFEISLIIEQFGGNTSQATLINLKDESQTNVWPGVAYRLSSSNKFEFTARWPGQSNASAQDAVVPPKTVKITRRNGIIYYSVANATETRLIAVPPASLTNPFHSNLTFGASTNASGNPFRFFNGIVSNIDVKLYNPS